MTGKNLSKDGQEYRLLFEEAPLPMCVVDSAGVKEYLDRLRDAGVTDLIDHFAMDPEDLIACFSLVRVLDVNVCALRLSGAADKQEFGERLGELLCEESYPLMMKELLAMADQREDKQGETVIRTFKGEKLKVLVKWTVMTGTPAPYSRVLISAADVTGRVAMEDQLKAAAAEWRDTFDASQDLVFILDRDFRVVRANAAAARFLQIPEIELTGRHCYELMHGSEEPVEGCPLAAMRDTNEHAEAELYLENHGIWAHISVDPILGRDGGVSRVVHVFKDITERKRTEEKLKESERLYRMLADNSQELICLATPTSSAATSVRPIKRYWAMSPRSCWAKTSLARCLPRTGKPRRSSSWKESKTDSPIRSTSSSVTVKATMSGLTAGQTCSAMKTER